MSIYDWPSNLLVQGIEFNPRGMTVSGPPSLTGRSQVASIDAGFWMATLSVDRLLHPEQVKAFRQLRALLEGGAHYCRVPVFDNGQAPWAYNGDTPITALSDVTFSDGALFSDGSEFFQSPITVEMDAAADIGDLMITVDVTQAGDIIGGEYFSAGNHLYVIKQILSEDAGIQEWSIWPRLRTAIPDEQQLNFARPICLMRLLDEASMDLALGPHWIGEPIAAFVEVFDDS